MVEREEVMTKGIHLSWEERGHASPRTRAGRWLVAFGISLWWSVCSVAGGQPSGDQADGHARHRPSPQRGLPRLRCFAFSEAPLIDGLPVDRVWRHARPIVVPARVVWPKPENRMTPVVMRSVRTDDRIYFLVRWKDETRDDVAHKPWVWNAEKAGYAEGPEREDMFALAFEHTGYFSGHMLSGDPGVWDIWQWKATRTNPQGYAMDRAHYYSLEKPPGKATSFPALNGKTIWIARPEDAGDTVEKKQPAPMEYQGDRVPQYLPGIPSASASDVLAKGTWSGGWWTLELERRLDTGHADDTAYDPARTYRMALSVHDRTGNMDKASGVIELAFAPRMEAGRE